MEATIVDKKMTVSAEEYFDNRNNRATLIMASGGNTPDTLVYDYANDQLFYIHGNLYLYKILRYEEKMCLLFYF